jgi:hypothetical protein
MFRIGRCSVTTGAETDKKDELHNNTIGERSTAQEARSFITTFMVSFVGR